MINHQKNPITRNILKRLAVLAAAVSVLTGSVPVYADLLLAPYDDDFYLKHLDECTTCNKKYTVNGPEDSVDFYESPDSSEVVCTLENGEQIHVEVIYKDDDGVEWGNEEYDNGEETVCVWAPMDYLWETYDGTMFLSDYQDEIEDQAITIPDNAEMLQLFADGNVLVYAYPGSEDSYTLDTDEETVIECSSLYTDEQGRQWGYISYYHGQRDSWICLDAPSASFEQLYPNGNAPVRDKRLIEAGITDSSVRTIQPEKTTAIVPKSGISRKMILIFVGAAVLAVVAAAGRLLSVILSQKSKKK